MNRYTLWSLERGLTTKSAQDAVEALFKAAPSLVTYADECHEVHTALAKICELLCLEDDFMSVEE